jgi:hypothetical protein
MTPLRCTKGKSKGSRALGEPPTLQDGFDASMRYGQHKRLAITVEFLQQRARYLLDNLRLLRGEVLAPASGRRLAIEFSFPLFSVGDGLPGVLGYSLRKLVFVRRELQGGTDAPHGPQGISARNSS